MIDLSEELGKPTFINEAQILQIEVDKKDKKYHVCVSFAGETDDITKVCGSKEECIKFLEKFISHSLADQRIN